MSMSELIYDHINLLALNEDQRNENKIGQEKLKAELIRRGLFLNMVIHDMRNPTTSIKAGIDLAIDELQKIQVMCKDQKKFSQKCSNLNLKFSD